MGVGFGFGLGFGFGFGLGLGLVLALTLVLGLVLVFSFVVCKRASARVCKGMRLRTHARATGARYAGERCVHV